MEYYLPKYASAYLNQFSQVDYGELLIGVSDEGFVSGIPYQGNMNEDKLVNQINNKVKEIIDESLKFNFQCDNILKYISWEIIDIKIEDIYLDSDKSNLNKKMNEYNRFKNGYEKEFKKFLLKKKVWYDLVNRFNDRLHNMLNDRDKREEIKKYIIRKNRKNKNKDFDFNVLIDLLKSKHVFNAITNIQLSYQKLDKSSIWYWVTRWKDDMISLIKDLRPLRPSSIPNNLHPLSIITTTIDMIPKWIENNKDMNLYLLKFTFKKPEVDIGIIYKENSIEKSCYRCKIDDTVCIFPSNLF